MRFVPTDQTHHRCGHAGKNEEPENGPESTTSHRGPPASCASRNRNLSVSFVSDFCDSVPRKRDVVYAAGAMWEDAVALWAGNAVIRPRRITRSRRSRIRAAVASAVVTTAVLALQVPIAQARSTPGPRPTTPVQSGSAPSPGSGRVSAKTTRANVAIKGRQRDVAPPASATPVRSLSGHHARKSVSASLRHKAHRVTPPEAAAKTGFSAKQSRLVLSQSTPNRKVYANPDGTMTASITAAATSSSSTQSDVSSTYVESNHPGNHVNNGYLYLGGEGDTAASEYVGFLQAPSLSYSASTPGPLQNAYVLSASVTLDAVISSVSRTNNGCTSSKVEARGVRDPWSATSLSSYPGPEDISSGPITYASFGGTGTGVTKNCPKKGATYGTPTNISIPITQLAQDWVHGWLPNRGIKLTSDTFTEFSTTGANKPTITVTYALYGDGANYAETSYVAPVNNQRGSADVLVQNEGSATWTPTNGYKLDYHLYKVSGTTRTLLTTPASLPAAMPKTVAPGQQVQLSSQLPALAPATYAVCWDMLDTTHQAHFAPLGVPVTCYGFVVQNNPPVFDSFRPDNNALVYTLTPTLAATAHDSDHYPAGAVLTYGFQLFNSAGTMIGSRAASNVNSWTVPAKTLLFGTVYNWRAQVSDGTTASPWSAPAYFTVPSAQQPLITSHLGAAPYDSTVKGVDPSVGNYSSSVTDAAVPDVPDVLGLDVTRTYNSLDPRQGIFFGSGWSSVLDMRAQPDTDGTGSVVITLADGRQERFAQNPDGTYSAPLGIRAWLTTVSGGGFRLVDDAHKQFTFTEDTTDPLSGQQYFGLTALGAAESPSLTTLSWRQYPGSNGVTATVPWRLSHDDPYHGIGITFGYQFSQTKTATGTDSITAHVIAASVAELPAGGRPDQTWKYGYDTDGVLTSVCPPTSPTSCTTYSYSSGANSGSHFASMVSDANPRDYYRLADPDGATTAADSVVSHEGTTDAVPHDVTFGSAAHVPGSPSTTANFNGTSSWVGLPDNLMGGDYLSFGMWFKTTDTGETLLGNQQTPPGGTNTSQVPMIYVGTDGKLRAKVWDGTVATSTSASAVNDGKWHYVAVSVSGTSQTLFVDGVGSTPLVGKVPSYAGTRGVYALGAGRLVTAFPAAPDSQQGFFRGSISDFWYAEHPIGLPQVQQEYSAGIASARVLTKITLPSGKQAAAMTYDAAADRVRTVTASDGGTWTLPPSTTSGSPGYYEGQFASTLPYDTYALDETDGAIARDGSTSLATDIDQDDGVYNDVTHNPDGLFGKDGPGAASFNGKSSYVNLPVYSLPTFAPSPTISLWVRTTTRGGTLVGTQNTNYPATPSQVLPVLYIGTDGKVHGGYYSADGEARNQLAVTSKTVVADGKWHMVTLSADSKQFQDPADAKKDERLFIDGVQEAVTGELSPGMPGIYLDNSLYYTQLGVGSSAGFPASDSATNTGGFFQGDMAQVGFWNRNIPIEYPGSVPALFKSRGSATGSTPTTVQKVLDPNGGNRTYQFDPVAGDRTIAYTDATRATTRFGYDDRGFQSGVTDANRHTTAYRRDALGDLVWVRRCPTGSQCQTSTATYNTAVGATAYASGKPLTGTDALGATTTYDYDPATGQRIKTTGPKTTDFPNGRSTSYTYTSTATPTADGGAGLPDLPLTVTDPRGNVTARNTYYHDGQLASETNALGAKTTYAYDATSWSVTAAKTVTSEYPDGITATNTFDAQNRVVTQTSPAITDAVTGVVHTRRTTYQRDVDGNVITVTDSDLTGGDPARITRYTYTVGNRVASVTDPNGHKTSYTYDQVGNNITETRPDGTVIERQYTARNELKSTQLDDWVGDPNAPSQASTLVLDARAYDPAGNLATETDSMGRVTGYLYNNDNTLAGVGRAVGTADQTTEEFERDADGRVLTDSTGCVDDPGSDYDTCLDDRFFRYDSAGKLSLVAEDEEIATIGGTRSIVFRDRHDFTYDANGNVLTDSESSDDRASAANASATTAKTTYAYDALNDQTQQTVANGSSTLVTKQGYSTAGAVVSSTDANGHTTTIRNNPLGQPDLTQSPAVPVESVGQSATSVVPQTAIGYDTFGDVEAAEDPNGNITQNTFDGVGNVQAQRRAAYVAPGTTTSTSPTTTFDRDSMDRVTITTDALGRKTTVDYDQLGNAVTATEPGNLTTRATFDTNGERLSQTSPTGARHESTYDDLGRRITDTDVVRQPEAAAYTTGYRYDLLSNQTEVDRPIGIEKSTFNGMGEKVTSTDARGHTTSYAYGLPNQLTVTTAADKTATKQVYDAAGRMTSMSQLDATGKAVRTASQVMDSAGNVTSATDPQGNVSRYTYDAGDRLATQVQPAPGATTLTSTFGYDAAGNRTRYTNPNRQSTGYTFNVWEQPESTIAPAVAGDTALADRATTMSYDLIGRTTGIARPGGVKIADGYDTAGRLISQSGSGAEAATDTRTFGYDGDGRLTSASSPKGANSYTYDDRGLMLTASGGGGTSSFAYNSMGWYTSRTDDAGTATFAHDADGNVTTQSGPGNYSAAYTYDTVDEPTKIDYGSSVGSRTMTYSPNHQLASDTTTSGTGTALRTATYGYNASGQQTAQTTKVPASGYSSSTTSTFDPAGRLATWTNGATNAKYSYDGDGNLLSDGTATSTFNERDQLTQQTSAGKTTSFAYSARGSLTTSTSGAATSTKSDAFDQQISYGSNTYSYDALGRLATASQGTNNYSFTYDGLGSDVTSDGSQKFGRGEAGDLVSLQTSGGGGGSVLTNPHGDNVGTLSSSGITGNAAYGPSGKPITSSGVLANLGFQGDWTDPATSSIRTASRWYSPGTGQFTSADSQQNNPDPAVHANPYAYGDADPLDNSDKSGHDACADSDNKIAAAKAAQDRLNAETAKIILDSYLDSMAEAAEIAAESARNLAQYYRKQAAVDAEVAGEIAALHRSWRQPNKHGHHSDALTPKERMDDILGERNYKKKSTWSRFWEAQGNFFGKWDSFVDEGGETIFGDDSGIGDDVERWLFERALTGEFVEASSDTCLTDKPQSGAGKQDAGQEYAPVGTANRSNELDPVYGPAGEIVTGRPNAQTVMAQTPAEAKDDPHGAGNPDTSGNAGHESPPAVNDTPPEPVTGTGGGGGAVPPGSPPTANGSCEPEGPGDVPSVTFSRSRAPGIAQNFDDAVAQGAPTRLARVATAARDANRRAALRGQPPAQAGQSLDEYPFACSEEGGAGSIVREVPRGEQNYQGGKLSRFFQNFGVRPGDPFNVTFGP